MSEIKSKKKIVKWIVGIAAMCVLLFMGIFGIRLYQRNYSVDFIVLLDVNPSIEIRINQNEKVLEINALNEDGETVIGDMAFQGSDIEVTVNALISSMFHNGYLNEDFNSILISVCGNNSKKANALQKKLSEGVNTILQTDTINGTVISQIVLPDSQLQACADSYNISLGKARMIQQYVSQEPQYSFEELAMLTINELNMMSKMEGITLEDKQLAGSTSDKVYIGKDKAKEIAFSHVGVISEEDVSKLEIEMDYEHDVMIYEVSFFYENCKYNYDINADTGEITEVKSNPVDNKENVENDKKKFSSDNDNVKKTEDTKKKDKKVNNTASDYIGEENAKETALLRANVDTKDIKDYKCEMYVQKNTPVYKIKFFSQGYEYSCDVNALTGEIVKYDKQPEHTK